MRPLLAIALVLLPVLACASEDDDCELAKTELNVRPTQQLGEECTVAFYGTCTTPFTSCAEGSCQASPGDGKKTCTTACKATTECRTGTYCVEGYCHRAASCTTTCDGDTCCTYAVDPEDPTRCKQTSCTKS